MSDTLITIIAIFLAAVLMFVFPLPVKNTPRDQVDPVLPCNVNLFKLKYFTPSKVTAPLDEFVPSSTIITSAGFPLEDSKVSVFVAD